MSTTDRQRDQKKRGHTHRAQRSQTVKKQSEIDWAGWWPFKRAEGKALRQLNKPPVCEDALL